MAKTAVLAKITAQDGKRDELVARFRQFMDYVNSSEPGTEIYAVHEDANDPNVVWFYELYADEASLAAHGGSDAMKNLGREMRDIAAGRPELIMLRPVAAKGVSF